MAYACYVVNRGSVEKCERPEGKTKNATTYFFFHKSQENKCRSERPKKSLCKSDFVQVVVQRNDVK